MNQWNCCGCRMSSLVLVLELPSGVASWCDNIEGTSTYGSCYVGADCYK